MSLLWETMLGRWLGRDGGGGADAPEAALAFAVQREAAASLGAAPPSEPGGLAGRAGAIEQASAEPFAR